MGSEGPPHIMPLVAFHPRPQIASDLGRNVTRSFNPHRNRNQFPSGNEILACVGRTPKRAYSTRGRSRHLLETPFSEPLLRTLLRTLFTVKPTADPHLRTLLRTLPPEPCPEPSQNPSQNAVLPYAPLGVHPIMAADSNRSRPQPAAI